MNYECELDKAWLVLHDIFYRFFKDLTGRTAADKVLRDKNLTLVWVGLLGICFLAIPCHHHPQPPIPRPCLKLVTIMLET